MALPIPNLDDRNFQELLDEARRLIPQYCPGWTDHNLSDPGITLLELFSTLMSSMIYRLNRVPEKSYLTFMDLMGIRLEPPKPAEAALTFRLGAELFGPKAQAKYIPADTEVAAQQTPTSEQPVSYCTYHDLEIRPPVPVMVLTTGPGAKLDNQRRMLLVGDDITDAQERNAVPVFQKRPVAGDAFYLGFSADLSRHLIRLTLVLETKGGGVIPERPPLVWEAYCNGEWLPAEIEGKDETGALNRRGTRDLELHLPVGMTRAEQIDRNDQRHRLFWLRCRYTGSQPDVPGYDESPEVKTLRVTTWGATTDARHAIPVLNELPGRSTGEAGQQFQLAYAPILHGSQPFALEVQVLDQRGTPTGTWEPWQEVETFAASDRDNVHFMIDRVSGVVRFGPRIREPDGQERMYGKIPPTNGLIRVPLYRWGGGAQGNKPDIGTLTVMTKTLPYVDSVTNRQQARGGFDAETIERAMVRAPLLLRTRERAVTAQDFEFLVRAADQGIARAGCLAPGQAGHTGIVPVGTIRLLLVPERTPPTGLIPAEDLRLRQERIDGVHAYLYDRRLLTTNLSIEEPAYLRVQIDAQLKRQREFTTAAVEREALLRLYRFLNPFIGGPGAEDGAGTGWPFGRDLFISEVFGVLMRVPGVAYVQTVQLSVWPQATPSEEIAAKRADRPALLAPDQPVSVPDGCLIRSERHRVTVND